MLWCLTVCSVLNCMILHQCGVSFVFVMYLPCWAPVLLLGACRRPVHWLQVTARHTLLSAVPL